MSHIKEGGRRPLELILWLNDIRVVNLQPPVPWLHYNLYWPNIPLAFWAPSIILKIYVSWLYQKKDKYYPSSVSLLILKEIKTFSQAFKSTELVEEAGNKVPKPFLGLFRPKSIKRFPSLLKPSRETGVSVYCNLLWGFFFSCGAGNWMHARQVLYHWATQNTEAMYRMVAIV